MKQNLSDYDHYYSKYTFQFLWGWNPVTYSKSYQFPALNFQFLWGWNFRIASHRFFRHISSFNSFEDETGIDMSRQRRISSFQFPWGWNVTCERCNKDLLVINFQFPWGWNVVDESRINRERRDSVLSIPLRMKRGPRRGEVWTGGICIFQFPWGWNKHVDHIFTYRLGDRLSIPLRMKPVNPVHDGRWHNELSIPLRMKLNCPLSILLLFSDFQFPWGWN